MNVSFLKLFLLLSCIWEAKGEGQSEKVYSLGIKCVGSGATLSGLNHGFFITY